MASGLSMPVGFKNTTDGNLQNAINAIQSARRAHAFLGINQEGATAIVRTTGNPDCHVVLRGGSKAPNYDAVSIRGCEELLAKAGLDARLMVDCSHAQTNKDYTRQPAVLMALVEQILAGNRSIMGVMLESNLGAGNQSLANGRANLKYGISITDPCIDWETTERCLRGAAEALAPICK
jgi:3-deoxy-7-phosphoheptulonate synthase